MQIYELTLIKLQINGNNSIKDLKILTIIQINQLLKNQKIKK